MKWINECLAMIGTSRNKIIRYTLAFALIFGVAVNITMLTGESEKDDDDILMSIYMEQRDLPPPSESYVRLSSFLDFSWASWGKDTTQFETLLPPSEIDFTIDKRLIWNKPDKCDDILMLMPYRKAKDGQGSQFNSYLMASMLATFLGKALVILEPPRSMNKYGTGSQFGCPVDAFEDETYTHVKEDFPDGLLRLIKHPEWISHGCGVPTCGGTHDYQTWDQLMTEEMSIAKYGPPKEFDCVEGDRNVKVTPLEGTAMRDLFGRTYRRRMVDRTSPDAKDNAYNWATRLGARHRDALHFSNLKKETQIWDYLTALVNRSGLLRFQPWIARDVAEYIRSSKLPLDISYDAIHVRRGDKLIGESKGEVRKYWASLGFREGNNPVNYVPFSHYVERAWDGSDCPTRANGQKKVTRRPKRIVYVATDDPDTVRAEISKYPHVTGGVTVLNECTKALFIFSPMADEKGSPVQSFHIAPCRRRLCPRDDCFQRYHRNIAAIADLMILTKSAKFVGEFNSNWGRLIRNFRTVLNDNSDPYSEDPDEPPVLVRDTVVAFGPTHPGPVGA